MSDLYQTLTFEPFVPEHRDDWPTLLTDECRSRIRTGAVLKVRPHLLLPEDWREAATRLRPEVVRDYLATDGDETWWETSESDGIFTFRYVPDEDDDESLEEVVATLPTSADAPGYAEAVAALVEAVTSVSYAGSPVEEWMHESTVGMIYETDEERPRGEAFYRLVGDCNEILGVCDDCTEFEVGDVEAVAYLPGFE